MRERMRYLLRAGADHWCFDSYDQAVVAAYDLLQSRASRHVIIGHDGDITDGGQRTLIWGSTADAEDDDGARAIATIREVG